MPPRRLISEERRKQLRLESLIQAKARELAIKELKKEGKLDANGNIV